MAQPSSVIPIVMPSAAAPKRKRSYGISKKTDRKIRRLQGQARKLRYIRKYIRALYPEVAANKGKGLFVKDNDYPLPVNDKTWTFGADDATANAKQKFQRALYGYRGKGDYRDWMKWASRGIGGIAGAAQGFMGGGIAGAVSGGRTGWGKGADFSRFMGWGDYDAVTGNQIIGQNPMQSISVNRSPDDSGDIIITNTEFVKNVVVTATGVGVTGFQIESFQLNAGLDNIFPFLSQVAQNYELYEFNGLMFQYKPTSGEGNNNNANSIGKVIMATQYDMDAPDFFNSTQMQNYDFACSTKPSLGLIHGVETDPRQRTVNQLYVRTGTSIKDRIFTDYGTFYVATEGIPTNAAGDCIIGELWVTYQVKLSRAMLFTGALGGGCKNAVIEGTGSATKSVDSYALTKESNLNISITQQSATLFRVVFPSETMFGCYMIFIRGSYGAARALSVTGLQDCAYANFNNNNGGPFMQQSATSPSFIAICVTINSPLNSQAYVQVSMDSASPGASTYRIAVLQVNQPAAVSKLGYGTTILL